MPTTLMQITISNVSTVISSTNRKYTRETIKIFNIDKDLYATYTFHFSISKDICFNLSLCSDGFDAKDFSDSCLSRQLSHDKGLKKKRKRKRKGRKS